MRAATMGDEDRGQAKMALGALLKASAAQQELQQGGDVSFMAAARAAKAKQDAQKLNKDTKRKIKVAIEQAKKLKKRRGAMRESSRRFWRCPVRAALLSATHSGPSPPVRTLRRFHGGHR